MSSFLFLVVDQSRSIPALLKKNRAHELIIVNPAAYAHYHLPKQTKEKWIVQVRLTFRMLYLWSVRNVKEGENYA